MAFVTIANMYIITTLWLGVYLAAVHWTYICVSMTINMKGYALALQFRS